MTAYIVMNKPQWWNAFDNTVRAVFDNKEAAELYVKKHYQHAVTDDGNGKISNHRILPFVIHSTVESIE